MLRQIDTPGFERVVVAEDTSIGYFGVIAVHSTARGPSVGGIRMMGYADEDSAIADATRLARSMSLKTAFAELPFGGGHSVIALRQPVVIADARVRLLSAHARAIDSLGGVYIAASDVGVAPADLEHVRASTPHVLVESPSHPGSAVTTARGVRCAVLAAAAYVWGPTHIAGKVAAVQGCGAVGSRLARHLADAGALVHVADTDVDRARQAARLAPAMIVPARDLPTAECDVFVPCALGRIVDEALVPKLRMRVIAGAASNQLVCDGVARSLMARGVTYVPDFVANAGGVVAAAVHLLGWTLAQAWARIDRIGDDVAALLAEARTRGLTPLDVATERAVVRLR